MRTAATIGGTTGVTPGKTTGMMAAERSRLGATRIAGTIHRHGATIGTTGGTTVDLRSEPTEPSTQNGGAILAMMRETTGAETPGATTAGAMTAESGTRIGATTVRETTRVVTTV